MSEPLDSLLIPLILVPAFTEDSEPRSSWRMRYLEYELSIEGWVLIGALSVLVLRIWKACVFTDIGLFGVLMKICQGLSLFV